jgi:hypothetical protein
MLHFGDVSVYLCCDSGTQAQDLSHLWYRHCSCSLVQAPELLAVGDGDGLRAVGLCPMPHFRDQARGQQHSGECFAPDNDSSKHISSLCSWASLSYYMATMRLTLNPMQEWWWMPMTSPQPGKWKIILLQDNEELKSKQFSLPWSCLILLWESHHRNLSLKLFPNVYLLLSILLAPLGVKQIQIFTKMKAILYWIIRVIIEFYETFPQESFSLSLSFSLSHTHSSSD